MTGFIAPNDNNFPIDLFTSMGDMLRAMKIFIAEEYSPEHIFNEAQLSFWAEENGYVRQLDNSK